MILKVINEKYNKFYKFLCYYSIWCKNTLNNESKRKTGRKRLPKKSKLIQISISQLNFRKTQLLQKKGFVQSYAQIVGNAFDLALQEKWKEFEKAFPELAKTIYDETEWE
jgi:hypothetical protein